MKTVSTKIFFKDTYIFNQKFYSMRISVDRDTVSSPLSDLPLCEPWAVRIESSIIRTVAQNFVKKLQITYGLKRDQAFVVYHAANRLERRPYAVPGNVFTFK